MIVYVLRNVLTGDEYVGKTISKLRDRFRRHKCSAQHGSQTHLHRAMRLYGIENFVVECLETVDGCDLNDREIYWINELKPKYNMTSGGDGGNTSSSPNFKAALARRNMTGANNPMFGKKGVNNPNTGSKRSDDEKKKMREALRNAWKTNDIRRQNLSKRLSEFNSGAQRNAKPIKLQGIVYTSLAEARRKTLRSLKYIKRHGEFL
jgi:group I intron endonuclease